ncbi:MAG TPA: hypothetical protein PKN76_06115 [bacterium]|nr:hypothetical protein [bacterium]
MIRNVIAFLVVTAISIQIISAHEKVKFRKYETEHQVLYFSSNLDDSVIPRLIKQAVKSEEFIKDLYGWVPQKKIITVYDRETDTANGWSRSYLKNVIYLYTYPPERYSTLSSYTSWEQGLHVHEYIHSVQIGNTKGFPKFINTVFGNLYFPGGMIPRWALEGAAIYSESLIEGKGRLNSPLYKAHFDSFFLKGKELSLGELSGIPDHWMGGGLPYLYGTYFYAYLVEKTGKKQMAAFFDELSDDAFPFLANRAARTTLGSSLTDLYKKFIREKRDELSSKVEDSSGEHGSKERFHSVFVDLNSDGYVFSGEKISKRGIYRFNEGELKKLSSFPSHESFSKKDEKYVFPLNIRHKDRYYRNEIFYADLKKRSIKKITENETAGEVVFGSDNDIYYTSFRDGINRITRMKLDGTVISEWDFRELDSIFSISLSSDGKKMVFTGNLYNFEKNIFIFDTENSELTEVRIDGDQYSVYFRNDDEIVFSAEKNGRIVPMSLNFKEKRLKQLHRPSSVAIFPKVINDEIFFIAFDNDGYYPAWQKTENIDLGKVPDGVFVTVERKVKEFEKVTLKDAKFYEGMFPALIIPDYQGSVNSHTIGFTVWGESNDQERFYDISYYKTFGQTGRHFAILNYFDEAVWPGFRWYFSYSREDFKTGGFYRTDAAYNRFNSGVSLSSSTSSPVFILPSKIVNMNHSIRSGLGLSGTDMNVKQLKDPLDITPREHDRLDITAYFSYGFSFSFNPGSYYLFSNMERTSFSFPVTIYRSLMDDDRSLVFSPSMQLSFLILPNGKLGFITRNALYMRFLTDNYFLLGGDELDIDILNLNTFIYGGSSSVTVRGYNYGAAGGKHVYHSNNELRFHLFSISQGFNTFPLMFKNVQGALFFDIGSGSPDINMFDDKFIAGIGAELKLYSVWWYRVPIIFTFGTAYGLTKSGQLNFYFSLGNSF